MQKTLIITFVIFNLLFLINATVGATSNLETYTGINYNSWKANYFPFGESTYGIYGGARYCIYDWLKIGAEFEHIESRSIVFDTTSIFSVDGILGTVNFNLLKYFNLYFGLGNYHGKKNVYIFEENNIQSSNTIGYKLGIETQIPTTKNIFINCRLGGRYCWLCFGDSNSILVNGFEIGAGVKISF